MGEALRFKGHSGKVYRSTDNSCNIGAGVLSFEPRRVFNLSASFIPSD